MGKSKRFEINRKWEQEFIILDTIHGIQDLTNLDKLEHQVEDLPFNMFRKLPRDHKMLWSLQPRDLEVWVKRDHKIIEEFINIIEELTELTVVSMTTAKLKIE